MVIDLPHDIKDVLVADPKIANAVVRSSRRAYIIGIAVGQTNVFFFDASGKQIAGFDIAVTRDLNGIRAAIKQVIPDSDITVEGIGQGVILSGTVANDAESQQAYDIAVRLLNDARALTVGQGSKIVNAIVVRGRDQVMLKVTVAEVERDLIKQLGINLAGSLGYGTAVVNFNNTNPFSAYGQSLSGSSITGGWQNISASMQAMEQAGVIHTLAEPNLTAISGETATFVAGGQFPVLNGYSCSATSTTPGAPVTLPAIDHLQEIRRQPELHAGRAERRPHQPQGGDRSVRPVDHQLAHRPGAGHRRDGDHSVDPHAPRRYHRGNSVRRLAGDGRHDPGLRRSHNINGFPGLMELPMLGPLFKSNDYVNQRTELMILVTPYIVRAVAQQGPVAARRRFRRSERSGAGSARPISTASTASAAMPIRRPTPITANTASSSIDARRRRRSMHNVRTMIAGRPGGAQAPAPRRFCGRLRRAGLRLQYRPADHRLAFRRAERLPPAPSDHDHGKTITRCSSSSAPTAAR